MKYLLFVMSVIIMGALIAMISGIDNKAVVDTAYHMALAAKDLQKVECSNGHVVYIPKGLPTEGACESIFK